MVENWAKGPVDGKLLLIEQVSYHENNMINVPLASSLPDGIAGVKVRKVTTLKKGIVAEANARDDVGSTERDLFDYWEKLFWGAIQN
jgi:hypothetical protein